MKENIINKLIVIFLILSPIIDAITGIETRLNLNILSIGLIVRGLFLVFIFTYLFIKKVDRKYLLLFISYSVIMSIYVVLKTNNNIFTEISNIMSIFYLPLCILFFSTLENKKINDKLIAIIYFMYLLFIIIPYFFNISFNTYGINDDKKNFIGLFNSGNEIGAVLTGLLPIVLLYLYKIKNIIIKISMVLLTIISFVLMGTKTVFLGLIIVIIYCIYKYIKNNYKKITTKSKIIISSIIIISIILVGFILPKTFIYKNMIITLNYYNIKGIKDLTTIKNIDNIIFSKRLTYLNNINNEYIKSNIPTKLFGLGKTKILTIRDIEIDVFDIFYSIGIIGFIIYLILLVYSIKKVKLHDQYKFSFYLLMIISLFSGHVLNRPMVATYIALLFILSRNNIKKEN